MVSPTPGRLSHGTAAWPDPLRMLPTCRPRPLGHRGADCGISLVGAEAELLNAVTPAPLPPW